MDEDFIKNLKIFMEDYEKLNKFCKEMFNDKLISDKVKNVYSEKYNALNIHRIGK